MKAQQAEIRRILRGPPVQAKLTVGQPNDKYEQEADRIADEVLPMPEPRVQRTGTCPECEEDRDEFVQTNPLADQITPLVQREIESQEEEEEEEPIQTKTKIGATPSVTPSLEARINSLRGGGQLLQESTRGFFESCFGRDFSNVRVHSDSSAAQAAKAVQAKAYTVGEDIVFGCGQYKPELEGGKHLLAHELAHVLQQSKHREPWGDAVFAQRYPLNTPHGRPYVAGVMHNHLPSGRWADIQSASSCLRGPVECACAHAHPRGVLMLAYLHQLSGYPLARDHLIHYVHRGRGADYAENVSDFINRDSGVRGKLSRFASRVNRGYFKVEQSDYAVQDFRYAFGAIDRLDYEVDSVAGTVHVWFVDRYEFHPVYPGIYPVMSGDVVRVTNCVHAAAVELKASGAADFWMVGYGTVPLSTVIGSTPLGGGTIL
ncbi:MAG: eCIS core domain-containing protein [Planctomycetota bacterium]